MKRAVVIMYEGAELSFNAQRAINNAIVMSNSTVGIKAGPNDEVTMFQFTDAELASLLAKDAVIDAANNAAEQHVLAPNNVEKAVYIIGNRFAEYLVGKDKNIVDFATALAAQVTRARIDDNDSELLNSIEVIINCPDVTVNVPSKTLRAKGFTKEVLHAIRKSYIPM